MEEILALQQQLAAAQRTTTTQKLSERNCVELVMKLQALDLIELIFTRSGKEYLTPAQLDRELEDELLTRGGRVNVTDLPDALNVALSHIEGALPKLTTDPRVRLVRGELITDDYLVSLVDEIDDALNASPNGTDSLAEVATRHALPVDLVRDTLSSSPRLSAHFDRATGTLTSQAAATRHRAQARGLLRATATPNALTDLAAEADIPTQTLREVADELLESQMLRGAIEGRAARAIFVPEVFTKAAAETLVSDFSANSFVRLDAIARMHVPDVAAFVKRHFPQAIMLSDCVVQPVVRDTISTTATEALTAGGWLDIVAAIPAGFPESDVTPFVTCVAESVETSRVDGEAGGTGEAATQNGRSGSSKGRRKGKSSGAKSASATKPAVVFAEQFVVSQQTVKLVEDLVTKHASEQAAEYAKEMATKMETVGNQAEVSRPVREQGEAEKEGGKKGKGKGRRRAGGKDKGGSKGTSNAQSEGATLSQVSVSVPSLDEVVELVLADEDCGRLAESDYLEQSAAGDEMVHAVLTNAFGDAGLHALYTSKAAEAVETLERERVQARKEAELALITDLQCAELFSRTADTLADTALVAAARSYVLDSRCVDILCRVVHTAGQSTGVVLPGAARAHELPSKRDKLDFVRSACSELAPTVASKVRDLLTAVSHSSKDDGDDEGGKGAVDNVLLEYDAAVTMLDLPERRALDKKSERATLANLRAQLVASLDSPTLSEPAALKTAVVLTHAKSSSGSVIDFADEDCYKFCDCVAENAKPPEAGALLKTLRVIGETGSSTEGENGEDAAGGNSLSSEFAEMLAALREIIG